MRGSIGIVVDASAFYPSIERFYDTGNMPFYRVGDVDGIVDVERATRIPIELCSQFPTLKRVRPGDILLTKGGAIDRAGYVTNEGAVSRDLIFLNTSRLSRSEQLLMFSYFRTAFFRRMLLRSSSQTTQPHLTITLVRELPIYWGSPQLADDVASIVAAAFLYTETAAKHAYEAGHTLLATLGLAGWSPPEPLSYTARARDAFAARRMDAEHFKVKFQMAADSLVDAGATGFVELGDLLDDLANGHTPLKHNLRIGDIPFLAAEHIHDFTIDYETRKRICRTHHTGELRRTALCMGDVLMTIKGRVGNTALVQHQNPVANINQDVALLRFKKNTPPVWYFLSYMNSAFGKLEVEKWSTGQINPFLGLYNLKKIRIPLFDDSFMEDVGQRTRQSVQTALRLRSQAKQMLETAKRAVEIAIESGEQTALSFLDQTEGAN